MNHLNKMFNHFEFNKTRTIKSRLLFGFVSVTLITAIAISTGSLFVGYYNGRQQALDRLDSVASQRESAITTWSDSLHSELIIALNEAYGWVYSEVVLNLAQDYIYIESYSEVLRENLKRFLEQSQKFEEIFYLDQEGKIILSTIPSREGSQQGDQVYFRQGLSEPVIQFLSNAANEEYLSVICATPIIDKNGEILGVMAGRAKLSYLQDILNQKDGLGSTGTTYLVNDNGSFLLGMYNKELVEMPAELSSIYAVERVVAEQKNGTGIYENSQGVQVIGVYHWIPKFQIALISEQNLSEAFRSIATTLMVNLGVSLFTILLAIGLSFRVTRSISEPIVELVDTTTRIAAGDLSQMASVEQKDEIGRLANSFNIMTAQLRELISGLEKRVKDRTLDLQQRALQLEISSKVSQEITSILDIDELLQKVVELIQDSFGYQQVQVYLVNREIGILILQTPRDNHVRLSQKIDDSTPAGQAAQSNQTVLINDLGFDPGETQENGSEFARSELVIPLRSADQVIGVLDVLASRVNGFDKEDILVLQSLADQIATAIQNARLYTSSQKLAVLEERNRLARELHDSVTQSLFSMTLTAEAIKMLLQQDPARADSELDYLQSLAKDALKEMRSLISQLRPSKLSEEGLYAALRQHIMERKKFDHLETTLEITNEKRLQPKYEEALYRIIQEALNNVVKHARTNQAKVTLEVNASDIQLYIEDNGCGFLSEQHQEPNRFGLTGMRERAELLGGSFMINSRPGEGTKIRIILPQAEEN